MRDRATDAGEALTSFVGWALWTCPPTPAVTRPYQRPALSIVAPSYNERAHVRPVANAIAAAMCAVAWELIVVDDDSPDGIAAKIVALRVEGWPVRVGRRGLASAAVEGALSAEADHVAVIDADLQHDERLLPRMLQLMEANLVIGSRYVGDSGIGDWDADRALISRVATRCATLVVGAGVTDPIAPSSPCATPFTPVSTTCRSRATRSYSTC